MNHVTLIGNLGRDPEARSTQSGQTVVNCSMATTRRYKAKSGINTGETVKETEWHNLVAFGRTAELMERYLRKGSKCAVQGRLQTRSWEDKKTGDKRYSTEIVVNEVEFLDGRDERVSDARQQSLDPGQGPGFDPGAEDDDIPF